MKKCMVMYSSSTGNTEQMAQAIAEQARKEGAEVVLCPASALPAAELPTITHWALGCSAPWRRGTGWRRVSAGTGPDRTVFTGQTGVVVRFLRLGCGCVHETLGRTDKADGRRAVRRGFCV